MRTGKLASLVAVLLVTALASWAQITITQGSYAGVGASYTSYTTSAQTNVTPGPGGANQNWTIPQYTTDVTTTVNIIAPSASTFGSHFPAATHCYSVLGAVSESFVQVGTSEVRALGFAANFGLELIAVYNPTGLVAQFPLSYPHANWTSVQQYYIEIFPGFGTTTRDSSIYVVDGWGTVNTQFGNSQVLRIFKHTWTTTTITGQPPQLSQNVSYTWVDQQGNGVASMSSPTSDPNFTTGFVSFSVSAVSADPVRGPLAKNLHIGQNYPNPFNPETTLPLSLDRVQDVSLKIYDETGRLVSEKNYTLPAGDHALPVNGASWAAGTYFANVTSGANSKTVKMQLLK